MSTSDLPPAGLRSWKIQPPADPNFRTSVWARIERERRLLSWPAYLRAHAAAFGLVFAVAVTGAGWAGGALAHAQEEAERARMANAYVANLDARVQAGLWD